MSGLKDMSCHASRRASGVCLTTNCPVPTGCGATLDALNAAGAWQVQGMLLAQS